MKIVPHLLLSFLMITPVSSVCGQYVSSVKKAEPNRVGKVSQALRYRPAGQDFVIENGGEFFNRPLYGGNTAFRVDAGDQPEFSFYLPGHGGNLRLGIKSAVGAKWLHEAESVVARYRPGTMLYEIRDALLGAEGVLRIEAVALHQVEGLVLKVEAERIENSVELVSAFGGTHGKRGKRGGDIGTEAVPIGEYFQLQAESCAKNVFKISAVDSQAFELEAPFASFAGLMPEGAMLGVADAREWGTLAGLMGTVDASGAGIEFPVMTSRVELGGAAPLYLSLQRRLGGGDVDLVYGSAELPEVFAGAVGHFAALRNQIAVETPDPYINAAVAALAVGVDAVWDEPQGVVMHGAIAWRSRLLGWRGPYAPDALGWHDRARRHFRYWATQQITDPIPEMLPPPDENANLARSEAALHSNGAMSKSHYDMNAVYIDALFRHLRWTGDLEFGRELWPVIERHLAWERRLFRREFGPEKLPLYEAYAAIWASDDLYYNGGGAAHSSAYNYFHNKEAARLARLLGEDAGFYEREADLIAEAMRELLWMPELGMFAEYKDMLGLQRIHPSAGLWTYYHTMDAELVTPDEAGRMSHYVNELLPRLPVEGAGVPDDADYSVLSSSNWMPYSWSINNVVMGENMHTALGLWQSGRADEAFLLSKSALIASMFSGICPGNVGTLNYLDVYRREAQRDFADGGGVTSRAVVEGLFGVQPDLLAGVLVVAPGFPSAWDRAKLRHPEVSLLFERIGNFETYQIEEGFGKELELRMRLPARGAVSRVSVNGALVDVRRIVGTESSPRYEIFAPAAQRFHVTVEWEQPSEKLIAEVLDPIVFSRPEVEDFDWSKEIVGTFEPVALKKHFNDKVTQIFQNEYRSPRPPFVSLTLPKQGIGAWAGHVNAQAEIDDTGLRSVARANGGQIRLPNGVPLATSTQEGEANIVFTSLWDNYPNEATVPVKGKAKRVYLLLAGYTNWMQSRIDNGEVIATYKDGTQARLALHNPDTWWPIDQDYLIDDYQFPNTAPLPLRLDLKTGLIRQLERESLLGGEVAGGAATVLSLRLDETRELRSLTLRTLSNDVVIGLMAATLER